jgi:hypothetical protein
VVLLDSWCKVQTTTRDASQQANSSLNPLE